MDCSKYMKEHRGKFGEALQSSLFFSYVRTYVLLQGRNFVARLGSARFFSDMDGARSGRAGILLLQKCSNRVNF